MRAPLLLAVAAIGLGQAALLWSRSAERAAARSPSVEQRMPGSLPVPAFRPVVRAVASPPPFAGPELRPPRKKSRKRARPSKPPVQESAPRETAPRELVPEPARHA